MKVLIYLHKNNMKQTQYKIEKLNDHIFILYEEGNNWKEPFKTYTFAFDTENNILLNGKTVNEKELFLKLKDKTMEERRSMLESKVWAFQCYDEYNGFFMTNDFETWLEYQCRCGYKYGWCYNATFDFAQIDYEILGKGKDKWKQHERNKEKAYNKKQPYTYESLHSNTGARYAYKLWFPYKNKSRHTYTHAIQYHDFMKFLGGGLKKLLEDLDVKDNEGISIRKLEMDYQSTNFENLSQNDIDYCCNDVKGLYFAIKQFNETIEEQSNKECSILGKKTNLMTAGGFAKRELLRSMYKDKSNNYLRLKQFQKDHPLTAEQDEYIRRNHLYRGGICFVNKNYKGKLIANRLMYRYDVNSEYPYAMSICRDLIGSPLKCSYNDYLKMKDKNEYEAIIALSSITGTLKENMVGLWYDPFVKDYVDFINENQLHLIFERELDEFSNWYDLEFNVKYVLLLRKGDYNYKDFIIENYELKAKAKKEGNKTIEKATKLKLNSSYGKLSERIEREKGHYELNELTNAIHFIQDGVETNIQNAMNVIVGSLITSIARCYIMSKIREICSNVQDDFVYIDTDSIHCFKNYDRADAYSLGGLKLEATCEAIKYIAPKTYIDIEKVENGLVDLKAVEIHSKGVNVKAVYSELRKGNVITLTSINDKIDYGVKYICLTAMNVKGGKVLIPVEKYIAREELRPDEQFSNLDGNYFYER